MESFFVGLIAVGEESGDLPNTFNYLADYLEQNQKIKSDIIKALTYPVIVVFILIVVILFLFTTVIPQLREVLEGFNAELPLITQFILSISDMLINYYYTIIGGLVFIILGLWQYFNTKAGRENIDIFLLKIPIFSRVFHNFYHIRFVDTLSVLLKGGVPLVRSLEISRETLSNTVYKNAVDEVIVQVKSGLSLGRAVEKQGFFDNTLYGTISAGEQAGNVSNVLSNISRIYKQRFDVAVSIITSLIQPLSIIVLGVVVGGTITAVMLPIYSLAGSIG